MRMRREKIRTGEELPSMVIVKPALPWLEARDNWMTRSCVMFRCMLARRIIAAADVTTFGASAKMQPPTSGRQAFNTAGTARPDRGVYAIPLRFHGDLLTLR
jgi:hypothetical protein